VQTNASVAQRMHWTTKDKHRIYVTVKRPISLGNQQRTPHFCGEIQMLFSSKQQRNKEENKRSKSNDIIHCVLLPPLCTDSSSIYND
jgi:hypothetical protein